MPNFSQGLTLDVLSKYFHLPINEVARELGICATVLKKICRKNSVPRWPHRKIKSIDKRLSMLQISLTKNPDEESRIRQELQSLQEKKELIYRQPNILALPKSRRTTKKRSRDDDSDDEPSDFSGSDDYTNASPPPPSKRRWSVSSPSGTPPPSDQSSPLRHDQREATHYTMPPQHSQLSQRHSAPTLPSLRSVAFHHVPLNFNVELPRLMVGEDDAVLITEHKPMPAPAPAPTSAPAPAPAQLASNTKPMALAGFQMLALAAESLDALCAAAETVERKSGVAVEVESN